LLAAASGHPLHYPQGGIHSLIPSAPYPFPVSHSLISIPIFLSTPISRQENSTLALNENNRIQDFPASVSGPMQHPLHLSASDIKVDSATPAKRKRGKSLSRRTGQDGHIEKSGRWYVVRYWKDIAGQEKRQHVRERICPISGPGSLSRSELKRKAKEIIQSSGVDTAEHSPPW